MFGKIINIVKTLFTNEKKYDDEKFYVGEDIVKAYKLKSSIDKKFENHKMKKRETEKLRRKLHLIAARTKTGRIREKNLVRIVDLYIKETRGA